MPATPLLTAPVHVTEAICRGLEDAGVDAVFGLSGGNTGRIYAALANHTETIRTVLLRNEAYATSAAEAYARASGKVAVAMAQGSWLLGQGIVGTLEALFSGTPMVLLGDLSDGAPLSLHAPYQSGTGEYGSWDARLASMAIAKVVFEPHDPVSAVQSVQLAIKHATSGNPGPVVVLFHSEALVGEVGPDSTPKLYASRNYLSSSRSAPPLVSDLATALRGADNFVILAGGGVRSSHAQGRLLTLAELTGASVVTTAEGKGTFPEEHPNCLGVFGNFGVPAANRALGAAKTILVLGSKLGPSDTALENPKLIDPARQRIIQVDIEPLNAAWTMPTDEVIVADISLVLDALMQELAADPVADNLVALRNAARAAMREADSAESFAESTATPLHPQRVIAELREALPHDAIICVDAGENRLLMCRYFESRAGGEYLQPAGAGGMGYAIPAALGAKVHAPDRTVVAVCGDGGLSMALSALMSAVEEDLPIIVVVLNNGVLGWVKHSQRAHGEEEFKSSLRQFDYSAIGAAIGFDAQTIDSPNELSGAVADAVANGRPTLLVVATSTAQTFVDLRAEVMA